MCVRYPCPIPSNLFIYFYEINTTSLRFGDFDTEYVIFAKWNKMLMRYSLTFRKIFLN